MKLTLKIIGSLIFLVLIFGILLTKDQDAVESAGFHYSTNGSTEFFENAYANVNTEKPTEKIAGITVNHHLIAPHLIAQEMALVATDKPITVVLLSPNHFLRGDGGVITSKFDWQTPYGILETDKNLADELKQTGLVNIDEMPFEQEHGINGIAGFIKKSLPNAKLVPLIVKDNLSEDKADQVAQELKNILPAGSLIIGSLDFSHYLTSNAAEFHDQQAISVINNFDYGRIAKLDVDSHAGLRILLKYFDATGNRKFVLTSHENSSTVTGNFEFTETTSYINGYFTPGSSAGNEITTALYMGIWPEGTEEPSLWNPLSEDYAFTTTERLFKYNDSTVSAFAKLPDNARKLGFSAETPNTLRAQIEFLNLEPDLIAAGIVKDGEKVTDIYLFPLIFKQGEIQLLPQSEAAIVLEQVAQRAAGDNSLKAQIKTGHIIKK